MVEIEIEVQCDECGAKLDAIVRGNTIYVSPCECQREKITDLETELKELKAHNEVLQKRVEEFSMELLDRIMRDNKDVLMRLKQAESEDNYENFDIERDYD